MKCVRSLCSWRKNRLDIQLHYVEKGEGEPLLLLHGNGENGGYFQHQMAYFSKKYRVIAVDTRGHGQSPRGVAPFTIRQFAEDLREFMDELGIEKANILGFSDGGNIAMVFALKYPKRVKRLILNGANLNGWGVKAHIQLPIVLGYGIASLFARKSEEARKNAEMLGLMVKDPNIRPEELYQIPVRTLVIAGTRDMIRTSHTRRIQKCIPKAHLVLLPGNHFLAAKNPEAFNKAVEAFLSSGKGQSSEEN